LRERLSYGTVIILSVALAFLSLITGAQIVVAKVNGQFPTITAAINACNDSAANPVTIIVMPGVYVESIDLVGRYISLEGVNKETCIIKTYTNDYNNPPIDLSTNSNLSNLTIIADDDGVTTPPLGAAGMPSYAVHFDIAGRGLDINNVIYQGVAKVKNCLLISKNKEAVGIGLSNKQELIWEDCEFIAFKNSAFYAHSYKPAGATQQKIMVRNCLMQNNSTVAPVIVQDANWYAGGASDCTDTVFTFINNSVSSEVYSPKGALNTSGYASLARGCLSGYIKLGESSHGNSIAALNS